MKKSNKIDKKEEVARFSYKEYNSFLFHRILDTLVWHFLKYGLFSKDKQKNRFFWEKLAVFPKNYRFENKDGYIMIFADTEAEVIASERLISAFRRDFPLKKIMVAVSTLSAEALAVKRRMADKVVFFPHDLPSVVDKFLKCFRPEIVVIVEFNIWPNFVRSCKKYGIPVCVVDAIFSQKQSRPEGLKRIYKGNFMFSFEVLGFVDCFCMQGEEDVQKLSSELPDHRNINFSGSLKFVYADADYAMDNKFFYQKLLGFKEEEYVLLAANIHRDEFWMMINCYKKARQIMPEVSFIFAPGQKKDIPILEGFLNKEKLSYSKLSNIKSGKKGAEQIIILDNKEELIKIYPAVKLVFVGNSLVYPDEFFSGQSLLGPVQFGVPIVFGPHARAFSRVAEVFLERTAAIEVNDAEALSQAIIDLLLKEDQRVFLRSRASAIFKENADAAEKTFACIKPLLSKDNLRQAGC